MKTKMKQFLNIVNYPNIVIWFYPYDMVLNIHFHTSLLPMPEVEPRNTLFLGPIQLNAAIQILWINLKFISLSAAWANFGTLF